MKNLKNRFWKALKYALPSSIVILFLWLLILSRSATMIFNYAMEQQDMFRGTITVEEIWADMFGNVEFEDLIWKDIDGETILHIPEGSLEVRPLDILSWNITSTTLKEFVLKNARISLRFDENMNVDFIRQSPSMERLDQTKPDWEKKVSFAGMSEEERRAIGEVKRTAAQKKMEQQWQNFNQEGHKLRLKLILDNCLLEIFYKKRHYYLSGVNFNADINSDKYLRLKAYTGRFGGTMIGNGITIHGDVNLTAEPVPECEFAVILQDVDPSSLGFGMDLHDPLTLRTYFTGPISSPIGDGDLHMERLRLPGLEFENVEGNIHYENAQLNFPNVSAKVFGGTLDAEGDYNIDTRYYHIHGIGKNLRAERALKGSKLSCLVDLEMYLASNESARNSKSYGSFTSGPGRYDWIPFDKISGRFSNAYRDLRFYDARIDIGNYQLQTDAISIINGKLSIDPIDLVNTETGEVRLTYQYPGR